jgi:hypothetical protein
MRIIVIVAAIAAAPLLDGCTSATCVGAVCQCTGGRSCDWNALGGCEPTTTSCTLSCNDGADCSGSCGASCTTSCNGASKCDLSTGDSAVLSCNGSSTCEYHAGAAARVSCNDRADCTFTVGDSASVSCYAGTVCHILCTGACAVSCTTSACDLTCPGETVAHTVSGAATCVAAG